MAKTKISEFSATPGNNTDIDSINIAENCAPSGINDAIRELMAQLKDFQTGAVGDSFNGPVGTTTAAAGAFTTLAASSTVTLSGGTANGVPYLNGSKVLTSGSALVFDGTSLKNTASSSGATPSANSNQLVLESSGNAGLTIATGASSLGNIFFADSGDNADGFIQYDQSGRSLRFGTATAEKMRLDSSGNLGLGVTPSAWVGQPSLQFSNTFSIGTLGLMKNAYYDGSNYKYISSNFASQYLQYNGQHWWLTAPSGTAGAAITFTQAMTLDASGNLGIGTSSPANRLSVAGPTGTIASFTNGATADFSIICGASATSLNAGGSNVLAFQTGSTERARIDSSGNLLVGNTSKLTGGIVGIDINNASPSGITFGVSGVSKGYFFTNTSSLRSQWETASGYTIVAISGGSGGVSLANGGASWGTLSDERHKDIIEPIADAADKVASLRAVIGKYKTDEEGTRRSFLIAQDVQAVLPEAIDSTDTENLALRYSDLTPLLVAAIKEQQALIQSLQADVAALKAAA